MVLEVHNKNNLSRFKFGGTIWTQWSHKKSINLNWSQYFFFSRHFAFQKTLLHTHFNVSHPLNISDFCSMDFQDFSTIQSQELFWQIQEGNQQGKGCSWSCNEIWSAVTHFLHENSWRDKMKNHLDIDHEEEVCSPWDGDDDEDMTFDR